jgi:hypothetical protein
MLFADPLSRVCGPTEGWFDPSLPRKLTALFEYLPDEVRNNVSVRVYAGKDTYAAGRLVQKWRKPTNPISKGKLLTKNLALDTFHIGVDDVNKCVIEAIQLIKDKKNFAILMPVSVTSEIARLENMEGERCFDKEMAIKVSAMSKVTLASRVWLINLRGQPFNHFLNNDMEGLGLTGCQAVFQDSLARERESSEIIQDYNDIVAEEQLKQSDLNELDQNEDGTAEAFPVTRSRNRSDTRILSPAANTITTGERPNREHETRAVTPVLENSEIRWTNVPKHPIPALSDLNQWIEHQLKHKRLPKEYTEEPPKGKFITSVEGRPEELLAIHTESRRITTHHSSAITSTCTGIANPRGHTPSVAYKSIIYPETATLLARDGQRRRKYMYSLPNVHDGIG